MSLIEIVIQVAGLISILALILGPRVAAALINFALKRLLVPREPDLFSRLQNPETEELRAIYREIDVAAGINDPQLVTPTKPETLQDLIKALPRQVQAPVPYGSIYDVSYVPGFGVQVRFQGKLIGQGSTEAFYAWLKGGKYVVVAGPDNLDGRAATDSGARAAHPSNGWRLSVPPKAEKRSGAPGQIGGFKSPAGGGGRWQGKDRP